MRHYSELILKPVVCRNSLADIVIPEDPCRVGRTPNDLSVSSDARTDKPVTIVRDLTFFV